MRRDHPQQQHADRYHAGLYGAPAPPLVETDAALIPGQRTRQRDDQQGTGGITDLGGVDEAPIYNRT